MKNEHGPNPFFQKILSGKIAGSIQEAMNLGYLDHPLLKGKFREYGIGRLLRDLIPNSFDLGTGIIQDCNGNQSKELDIIIWSKNAIPPLLFSENSGVYPLEACCYSIEVKSILTSTELKKAIENAKSLIELYTLKIQNSIALNPVRVLFAYSSDISIDSSELERYKQFDNNWNINPIFNAICIVGKGYYSFIQHERDSGKPAWLWAKPNKEYYEVSSLFAGIINTLTKPFVGLGYYVMYPETDREHGELIIC